jgi:predicted RNase H-like HicB family nuclease
MLYAVLLKELPDGKYQASVPLIPGLTQIGKTRSEALQEVEKAIATTLSAIELVYVEVPTSPATGGENPWLATAGMFADDPTLEPMLEEIYAARDEQ